MASVSLFALIDDIATLLDDVAAMTKVATKKTAGVLGDDLALNAQQVSGVSADRELPVVWAVAKRSLLNKCILVPVALLISVFAPWAIVPLLMIGGAFLCFEGFEKVFHRLFHHSNDEKHDALKNALQDPAIDMVAFEKDKIRNAVRTDFILSAEIIAISMGTIASAPFLQQALVLSVIAIVITVGVYGLVAGIVKLDDAGLYLCQKTDNTLSHKVLRATGKQIVIAAPKLMRLLTILGTAAMFLVGGGILTHGISPLHHAIEHITASVAELSTVGQYVSLAVPTLADGIVGIVAGGLILLVITLFGKIKNMFTTKP